MKEISWKHELQDLVATPVPFSGLALVDVGAAAFLLPTEVAYLANSFRLNTQADGLGTNIAGWEGAEEVSALTNFWRSQVFMKVTVTDPAYQTGTIYAFGDVAGSVVMARDMNRLNFERLQEPGFNFSNGSFDLDATGWNLYDDGAAAPVDGTGGSPTALTVARSTTLPIIGLASGLLSKAAINGQGEGLSFDFTLDPGARLSPAEISFLYSTSGAYASGDIKAYIYDIDAAAMLLPSLQELPISTSPSEFRTTFFPNATSQNYRLIFHVATVNAAAWALKLDEVRPSTYSTKSGAVISEWQSYTPVFSAGFGTVTETNCQWRRVGSVMEIKGVFKAGTVAGSVAEISLPTGYTAKVPVVGSAPVYETIGQFYRGIAGATTAKSGVLAIAPNSTVMQWASRDYAQSGNPFFVAQSVSVLIANNDYVFFSVSISINQWTANINLASDFTEYASNSSVADADDTTSFANGAEGSSAMFTFTGAHTRRVRFLRAIRPSDVLLLEFYDSTTKNWLSGTVIYLGGGGQGISNLETTGATLYYINTIIPLTDVTVYFQRYRIATSNWATSMTNLRWRVRKISNGNMAESGASIIDSGYDINMNYIEKRGDGRMKIVGVLGAVMNTTNANGSIYYATRSITFPVAFRAGTTPSVIPLIHNGNEISWPGKCNSITNTGFTFVACGANNTVTAYPYYIAEGYY